MEAETSMPVPVKGQAYDIYESKPQNQCRHHTCTTKHTKHAKNKLQLTRLQNITAWILFFYPSASITALTLLASALPQIVAHRLTKEQGGHWTGRWVEIPATSILGIASITNLAIFWHCGAGSKLAAKTNASIHMVLTGQLLWTLVLVACASGSVLWHKEPVHGGSGRLAPGVLSVCNTLTGKGQDCHEDWLWLISSLQRSALAFFVVTFVLQSCLFVISCIEYRQQVVSKRAKDIPADEVLHFSNDIEKSKDLHDGTSSLSKETLVHHNELAGPNLEYKHNIIDVHSDNSPKAKNDNIIR